MWSVSTYRMNICEDRRDVLFFFPDSWFSDNYTMNGVVYAKISRRFFVFLIFFRFLGVRDNTLLLAFRPRPPPINFLVAAAAASLTTFAARCFPLFTTASF